MKIAPLSGGFMITAIAGFLFSALYILPKNLSWGVMLLIFFSTMFIASFISMTKAPVLPEKKLK